MARIFLIVSMVLSIGSAVLAFLTKGELQKVGNGIADSVKRTKSVVTELEKTTELLDQTKGELVASQKLAEDRQGEIGALNRQLVVAKDEVAKSKQEKSVADKQIADTEAVVEKAKKDIEKVQDLEKELADLKASSMNDATAKVKEIEQLKGEVASLKRGDTVKSVRFGMDEPGPAATSGRPISKVAKKPAPKSGVVLSYDADWNFAVVSIGDRSGITPETVLYAMRGDATVSKLRVSKLYPDRAVVYPEVNLPVVSRDPRDEDRVGFRLNLSSSRKTRGVGETIRVGDKVVIVGGDEKKDERAAAVAAAKSAAATAPLPSAPAPAAKPDAADPLLAIPGLPGLPADDKPAAKPAGGDAKDAAPDPFKLNFN